MVLQAELPGGFVCIYIHMYIYVCIYVCICMYVCDMISHDIYECRIVATLYIYEYAYDGTTSRMQVSKM